MRGEGGPWPGQEQLPPVISVTVKVLSRSGLYKDTNSHQTKCDIFIADYEM